MKVSTHVRAVAALGVSAMLMPSLAAAITNFDFAPQFPATGRVTPFELNSSAGPSVTAIFEALEPGTKFDVNPLSTNPFRSGTPLLAQTATFAETVTLGITFSEAVDELRFDWVQNITGLGAASDQIAGTLRVCNVFLSCTGPSSQLAALNPSILNTPGALGGHFAAKFNHGSTFFLINLDRQFGSDPAQLKNHGNFGIANLSVGPIPEPSTYALLLCGLAALGWRQHRAH